MDDWKVYSEAVGDPAGTDTSKILRYDGYIAA
jgi:hypothetical protein